jgi:hypothetical protein
VSVQRFVDSYPRADPRRDAPVSNAPGNTLGGDPPLGSRIGQDGVLIAGAAEGRALARWA